MDKISLPVDAMYDAIQDAVAKWKAANTPDVIAQETVQKLEEDKEEIILQLLGFEKDNWGDGKYKLDHCNGRSGESAAGDFIRRAQKNAINTWLASVVLPAMPEHLKENLIDAYNKEFQYQLIQQVEGQAATNAAKLVDEFKETIVDKLNIDARIELEKLLQGIK